MTRSLPNLVKQRFVVEKSESTRIINSNEKFEKLVQKNQGEFQQGLFAAQVTAESEDVMSGPVSGIEALVTEYDGEETAFESISFEGASDNPMEDASEIGSSEEIENRDALAAEQERIDQLKEEAESLLVQAREEAEQIRKNAYDEGMASANLKLEAKMEELENQKNQEIEAVKQAYQLKYEEMEPMMIDAILPVIEDVLKISIDDYRQIIADLMRQTILGLDNPKEIQVQVSDANLDLARERMMELKGEFSEEIKLEVVRNSLLNDTQCRIETEVGIYDCGFDAQLDNLLKRIKALSRQKC